MIPKRVSSSLKVIAVIFPIMAGIILTSLGIAKLSEAKIVTVEPWYAPYGFLVFGSTPLGSEGKVGAFVEIVSEDLRSVERNVISVHLWISFEINLTENLIDEVAIGFQFPSRIVNYEDLKIAQMPGEVPVSIVDEEIVVLEGQEEEKIARADTSVFYAKFNPSQYLKSEFELSLGFEWEGSQHRDSFSSFTQTFPVAVSAGSAHDVVYERFPNAYIYYGDDVLLLVDVYLSWDFKIKGSSHPSLPLAETGEALRPMRLNPSITKSVEHDRPVVEIIMVEFEAPELSERRDRLLFDSGLYMGLGVGMLFSGIHEALRVAGELRRKAIHA